MTQEGLDLIKKYEGLRLEAYKCPAGVWTIGYGHTKNVKQGQIITEQEAENLLINDVKVFEDCVNSLVKTNIKSCQKDALISFAYNLGCSALKGSTLLKKVNANPEDPNIANEFSKWNKSGGRTLAGLTKRRNEESKLYFSNSSGTPIGPLTNRPIDNDNRKTLSDYVGNVENYKLYENPYELIDEIAKTKRKDVKNISKRLRYIEPNDVYGHIDGQPVTPDYTDYCIYFNLIAERVSRVKGGSLGESMSKEKVMATWHSKMNDPENNYVKYIDGSTIGGKNFLTNFESDIHFNDLKDGKVVEGLGVSSVSINFEAYFTPTISIKFVDTRGSGLFGYEEIEHGTKDGTISQDTLFGAFFTFPYPKFTLVVKGFYGRPVSYQLTCSDFRATFNSDTGNFEATASFIGYQFSLLTDIPMSFLVTAPYCEYIGKPYWDKHASDPDWAMDNGSQPIRLKELIEKIDDAIENSDFTEEVTLDSTETFTTNEKTVKEQKNRVTVNEYDEMLNSIKKLYVSEYTDENGNKQTVENFIENAETGKILFIKTPYNMRDGTVRKQTAEEKQTYDIFSKVNEKLGVKKNKLTDNLINPLKPNNVQETPQFVQDINDNISLKDEYNNTYEYLDCKYFTEFMDKFVNDYSAELDKYKGSYPCEYQKIVFGGHFPKGSEYKATFNVGDQKSKLIGTKVNTSNNQIEYTYANNKVKKFSCNKVFLDPLEAELIFNKTGKKQVIPNDIMEKLDDKFFNVYASFLNNNNDNLYNNPNVFIRDCRFLLYDDNGFRNLLTSEINLNNEEKNDIAKRQTLIVYKDIKKLLNIGFDPYIGNIFKIIMCHLETFTEMVFQCVDKIGEQILSGERECSKLGIKIEKTDVAKNLEKNVPPFPELYNAGIKNDKGDVGLTDNNFNFLAWPGDFKKENWEEAKLIESIVKCVKNTYFSNENFESNINNIQEDEFKIENYPLFHFDIENKDTFPEFVFKRIDGINKTVNPLSNLAGYLGLRASSALFMLEEGNKENSDLMFELGKLESIRLLHQLKTINNVHTFFDGEFKNSAVNLSDKMCYLTYRDSINKNTINAYEYNIKDRTALYSGRGKDGNGDYEYIVSDTKVKINNKDVYFKAPIIPCNFNSISDIKKNTFFYDGSFKRLKGKNEVCYGENSVVVNNSLNNGNLLAQCNDKLYKEGEYMNTAMFKVYIGGEYGDGIDFARAFCNYMEEFETSDYQYNNVSFGEFKKLKQGLFQDNIRFTSSYLLHPRYDITNGDDRLPLEKDCSIDVEDEKIGVHKWYDYIKDATYKGFRFKRSDFNEKYRPENTVFKDFLTTNSLLDDSDKHSLFLDDSYYYFNKYNLKDRFIGEASKAFLFLHSTFNDNPLSIFDDKVKIDKEVPKYRKINVTPFELATYNDLLFYGGVSWFYENKKTLPQDLVFREKVFLRKNDNHFALYRDLENKKYFKIDKVYYNNIDDYSVTKLPNVRHQLAMMFKNFVLKEWPAIRDVCELKYRRDNQTYYFSPKVKISRFLSTLNTCRTNSQRWEFLSGKKYFASNDDIVDSLLGIESTNSDGDYFLENFVGSYRDIHGRMLLLDEDGYKVQPVQNIFKRLYTEGVIVGTCYNKDLKTYNMPANRAFNSYANGTNLNNVQKDVATLKLKTRSLEYRKYFDGFFTGVNNILNNYVETEEKVSETDVNNDESKEARDFYIPVYTYLKNLWDKWLSIAYVDRKGNQKNNSYSVKNFFGNFIFIDQFYVNIYKKLHINCEILQKIYNENNWTMSIYKFITDIANEHHCIIYPMVDFPDLGGENGEEELAEIFKPVPYNEIKESELRDNNHFVVTFTYSFCDKLNIYGNEYVSNGFDIYGYDDAKNIVPAVFDDDGNYSEQLNTYNKASDGDLTLYEQKTRYGYNVPSFGVTFSRQNNALFKKINVGMQNPTATEQSMKALANILEKAKGNDKKVCFYGQDLYPVFNNVSYSCDIEMMGDVQIAQLMYFQLLNVPMFRGAYQIYNVSHEISPGNIVTRFKGMKMANRATPYPIAWYMDLHLNEYGELLINDPRSGLTYDYDESPYTVDESYGAIEEPTIYNGTVQPVVCKSSFENNFWKYRTKEQGYAKNYHHTGIDVPVGLKTPVYCVWDGVIEFSRTYGGGGQTVKVKHDNGYDTYYMHLINFNDSVVKRENKRIKAGECVGWSGGEDCNKEKNYKLFKGYSQKEKCANCKKVHGYSSGPHLHFEIRERSSDQPVDPTRLGINFGNNNLGFSKHDKRR